MIHEWEENRAKEKKEEEKEYGRVEMEKQKMSG